jgi:hypothetical protein
VASDQTLAAAPDLPVGWRFRFGMVLFVLGIIPWALVVPLVLYKLPLGTLAAVTTVAMILQKATLIAAIVVLGKPGFAYLKGRLFGHLKGLAPAAEVGPLRHWIGVVLFCIPLLQGWLESWAGHVAPQLVANRAWVDVGTDVMLVASLFVLGGNFWDKLRALFMRNARALFPEKRERDVGPAVAIAPAQ